MIKKHVHWLEEHPLRMRKFIAILTMYVWICAVVLSYILSYFKLDTLAILSLVTAQFATVIGFYMMSNAKSDTYE